MVKKFIFWYYSFFLSMTNKFSALTKFRDCGGYLSLNVIDAREIAITYLHESVLDRNYTSKSLSLWHEYNGNNEVQLDKFYLPLRCSPSCKKILDLTKSIFRTQFLHNYKKIPISKFN